LGAGSRDDDDGGGGGGGGGGDDDDDDDDGGESAEDLRQTISSLRHSIMAHAESSAESGERLSSLRAAHDSLLAEHLRLQEQMDDAVELLKYLKEEKGGHEDRISELSAEVESLRDAAEGDVVSMTISNLTREKMALESQLAEERRGGLARAAVAACAGMDDGGGGGGSTATSTYANREVVERLERKNAELADEVESLRKAQSESTKRIEDMKRTNRVVEEAQKEKERARRMAKEEEDDDRAARYEGERIELLRRVEELGRELGSARAAREIEERESRRLRDAASASGGVEGERSAAVVDDGAGGGGGGEVSSVMRQRRNSGVRLFSTRPPGQATVFQNQAA
jgi:predicted RNase H-like nuclease (RuvC/YqgF family)